MRIIINLEEIRLKKKDVLIDSESNKIFKYREFYVDFNQ